MLKDKIALVTGASLPRGIGRACARALAEKGAKVVVADLVPAGNAEAEQRLQEAVAEIETLGVEAIGVALDVTDTEQVNSCVEQVLARFGRIDILVNNAGVGAGTAPFLEIEPDAWQLSWNVNVMGIVNLCRAVIPQMQEHSNGGSIINMASLAGLGAPACYGAYTTTKHAVMGLTKTLAGEFGRCNIRVNAVCPGFVDTDMNDIQIQHLSDLYGSSPEQTKRSMEGQVPLKRFAQPEDVGKAVAFLASDEAAYLAGISMPVAGGLAPAL